MPFLGKLLHCQAAALLLGEPLASRPFLLVVLASMMASVMTQLRSAGRPVGKRGSSGAYIVHGFAQGRRPGVPRSITSLLAGLIWTEA